MKFLSFLAIFSLTIFSFSSSAQSSFGNEWIVSGQKYVKIKVSETGIYKISYSQLQSLGFLTNSPNPKNFKLYFQGKEIPIVVNGESDNSFDASDNIVFLGKKNDGELDKVLYSSASHQPNSDLSLFSDESSYFLTWSASSSGKRYQFLSPSSSSIEADPYIICTASANFSDQYYAGLYLLDVMSLSEYIDGEGFMGNLISKGGSFSKDLATPNKVTTAAFQPFAEFYVAGRSNSLSTSSYNHHIKVSVGNTTLKDTSYSAYATIRVKSNLNLSDISNTTTVLFKGVDDLGGSAFTDYQAPAYARITYPRNLDMTGVQFIPFKVRTSTSDIIMKMGASTLATGNQLKFLNSNWQTPLLLDTANAYAYKGTSSGGSVDFVINSPANATIFAGDENSAKTAVVENISFSLVNATSFNSDLLIITNSALSEATEEFADYKSSQGYKPFVITTDQLYNQFYYGVHHPLAIRNFLRYLLNKTSTKPEYLLLMGKGYESPRSILAQDLVPTMGYPASDAAFSSQIIDNNLAPALATGRIPAKTNQEIRDYLNKLKAFDALPDSLYRKRFIHITGGKDIYEGSTFVSYLKGFGDIAKTQGSEIINYNKKVTDAVTENLTEKIVGSINQGAGFLSFFGHGSIGATEVSLGTPASYSQDRLLFYMINGCSTANTFTAGASMGENFLLAKNRGAIAWMGTTSEGVASYLNQYTNLFYKYSFINNYGSSAAKNMTRVARDFQISSDFSLNRAHVRQYIYLGDPTIALYSPSKPDFQVSSTDIYVASPNLTASSETIKLGIIVRNTGKVPTGNLAISVKRTFADGTTQDFPAVNYPAVANTDTLFYTIDNMVSNAAGDNIFKVSVDPNNAIAETNETNNSASASVLVPSSGVSLVSPTPFGIQASSTLTLKVQQSNLLKESSEYLFELDSVNTFNSNWKKSSPVITSGVFATWKPSLTMQPGKVYYWRARLNITEKEGGVWKYGSFTYIPDSPAGWMQAHYQQLDQVSFYRMAFNNDGKSFKYSNTTYPIAVRTRGDQAPTNTERSIRISISGGKISFNTNEFEGFSLVAFHPVKQGIVFNYPSSYNFKNDPNTYTGQFYFNPNNATDADSLVRYINNIPAGYFVVGMSGVNLSPKDLPANVKTALSTLGLALFNTVGLGEPYSFSGVKGATAGSATEFTADYSATTPARQQAIANNITLPYPFNAGYFVSEKVGPSNRWESVTFDIAKESSDEVAFDVIGVDENGNELNLFVNNNTGTIDLSQVSATEYPYLKLRVNTKDATNYTPAQLRSWKVLFEPYPDIAINTEVANTNNLTSIARGDSLRLSLGISNLDIYPSDSIDVVFEIIKKDRTKVTGTIATLAPLAGSANTSFNFAYPTEALVDSTVLQVYATPKNLKDRIALNNRIAYNFMVVPDLKEPLVDVLFDGQRIVNGEVVSPKPNIAIAVTDENKFMILNDTTSVEVYLQNHADGKQKRVAFSSNKITMQNTGTASNNQISYLFSPEMLVDGTYSLKVRSKDKSGNFNTTNDYLVDFEVINEASITNFLPYPNPFTTSMQFVFKITGQKIPDKIKVQILTSTGKIVREVLKEELGDLRIGNNISSFRWDGTDQFGDRLANGVYFYRVQVENTDKAEIKHRATSSDAMFKQNYGKIYLMR